MIGEEIIRFPVLGSTNQYLLDLISVDRPPEGTVVVTAYQTAGRGMDKNKWESSQGLNLTFSVLFYPVFLEPVHQFSLNKAVSLAITDYLRHIPLLSGTVKIKWPNDIYINDQKLAGILIQNGIKGSTFDYCIVGIGLNVNQETFGKYPVKPISLKLATGKEYDLEELLHDFLIHLETRYDQLKTGQNSILDRDYLDLLYRFGEYHEFIYRRNKINARITGVNQFGQLVLEKKDGETVVCDLKEVKFC